MDTNILIIGNGFDIAHGLPTKYTDFLRYCRDYYKNDDPVSNPPNLCDEFESFCKRNLWLKYFQEITELDDSKTWIDFEKEISTIIKEFQFIISKFERSYKPRMRRYPSYLNFDKAYELLSIPSINIDSKTLKMFISFFCKKYHDKYIVNVSSIIDDKSFIEYLYVQLRKFTRAFEIYCLEVNKTPITQPIVSHKRKIQIANAKNLIYGYDKDVLSSYMKEEYIKKENMELDDQINKAYKKLNILSTQFHVIDYLDMSKFDCVLSFNYTNTYERLYGNSKTRYCYIHGKAQRDKNETNIIFGIDDDLPHGEESSNFKWVRFKKYYQRIIYRTGSEYMDWFDRSSSSEITVHIVGHSLDKTDYDILYDIFDNQNIKIIVYYYSPKDFEDKVQKVIQLLAYKDKNGRDELIRRVHGSHWSIKFVDQYDEVDGMFLKPGGRWSQLELLDDLIKV